MILVAGGSGRLGSELVDGLRAEGTPVRVLTRSAATAERLRQQGVEAVTGDLREPAVTERAVAGCTAVVSAITGFGPGAAGPEAVDRDGNRALIQAARAAGVQHVVLLSVHGAAEDAPAALFRMKAAAERALRESGVPWTIIRPTAYFETHLEAMGAALPKGGPAQVFGAGGMPVDFLAVRDAAALVLRALHDPALRGRVLEIGGERHTMTELAEALSAQAGGTKPVRHVPRPALRVMSVAARPFSPFLARVARMAVLMDTVDLGSPRVDARTVVPGLPVTTLDQVLAARPAVAATAQSR